VSYLEGRRLWGSWGVLAAGVFSTGLLGALLMLATGQSRRNRSLAEQRAHQLEAMNERLLAEIAEREHAEAALRQAQRLEAIGQLTGGIAHDFNNLLTVIGGNASMLQAMALSAKGSRRVEAVLRAADRGQRLTRQLLAFSRRQTLRPELINLRQRASEITEMLATSLREDIELLVAIADDVWPVEVDRGELDLALLNVGVNSRDAMPNGGTFRLEALNVCLSPEDGSDLSGDFVAVRLSDTGVGMAAEVASRAFEPFYTTKEVGQGSGLGLSQVYGFARQSGGTVAIASEPGNGTTVTLFLPRAASVPS
jgi:two-component system NtrC family sensor kinase